MRQKGIFWKKPAIRQVLVERVKGIEPSRPAWKAGILPLNYTRKWSGRRDSNSRRSPWQGDALPLSHSRIVYKLMVGVTGIEPATSCSQSTRAPSCATPRRLFGWNGAGEGNRTLTTSLEGWNSTIELHPHNGDPPGNRTPDTMIKSHVLYRLS